MRRLALVALTLASIAVVAACLVGSAVGQVLFVVVVAAFPAILMAVGAADRDGRLGSTVWPIALVLAVLESCFLGMLALSGSVETGAWVLGLPAAAALQLYGVLLAPLPLVALGYALTFDSFGVSDGELERLRELTLRPATGATDDPGDGS